jgi:phage portal protein BeeE
MNSLKLMGVNKEVDLTEIPFMNPKEIIELDRWIGLKVASIFKVPPFMLNLVQDVGSLNAREQKARFLENVILPILEYEAYTYTNVLVRKGFKNFDVSITSPVLGTKLNYDRARIANLLVGSGEGILTVDEARKMFFNLPPKEKTSEDEE